MVDPERRVTGTPQRSEGYAPSGMRAWPAALLVPLLVMGVAYGVAYGIVWITGVAPFSVPERPLGADIPRWLLPVVTVWLIVQASLTTALGEEIGWRGYLQKRFFAGRPLPAAVATGLIWGVWHYPLVLAG